MNQVNDLLRRSLSSPPNRRSLRVGTLNLHSEVLGLVSTDRRRYRSLLFRNYGLGFRTNCLGSRDRCYRRFFFSGKDPFRNFPKMSRLASWRLHCSSPGRVKYDGHCIKSFMLSLISGRYHGFEEVVSSVPDKSFRFKLFLPQAAHAKHFIIGK